LLGPVGKEKQKFDFLHQKTCVNQLYWKWDLGIEKNPKNFETKRIELWSRKVDLFEMWSFSKPITVEN